MEAESIVEDDDGFPSDIDQRAREPSVEIEQTLLTLTVVPCQHIGRGLPGVRSEVLAGKDDDFPLCVIDHERVVG